MNRLLLLLAAVALSGAAAAAPQAVGPRPDAGWYYWLHPKLGMVKVDRATNAMIVSGKHVRAARASGR